MGQLNINDLTVKIFADGADIKQILSLAENPLIKGFTTNPSLMRKAQVTNYQQFAEEVVAALPNYPISFEVFADDLPTMELQARTIAGWGKNVYVKIPITNTKGEFTIPIIKKLAKAGICLNVTAILTIEQVYLVADALDIATPAVVSVFAGRIADSGVDPIPVMRECARILQDKPNTEVLWASSRELLNILHAQEAASDIITVSPSILQKLSLVGKDLDEYSLETVQMFYQDATAANFSIKVPEIID